MGNEKRSSVSSLQVPCVDRRTSRRTSGFKPFAGKTRNRIRSGRNGTIAFMSWLMVTGTAVEAIGNEWASIIPRTTMRREPVGMSRAADCSTADVDMWSWVSVITSTFISFGLTQGMEPFQNSESALLGVPPPSVLPIRLNEDQAQPEEQIPRLIGNVST